MAIPFLPVLHACFIVTVVLWLSASVDLDFSPPVETLSRYLLTCREIYLCVNYVFFSNAVLSAVDLEVALDVDRDIMAVAGTMEEHRFNMRILPSRSGDDHWQVARPTIGGNILCLEVVRWRGAVKVQPTVTETLGDIGQLRRSNI